ncbi:olfactory receptor 11A1-like [Hyla sarda]|uniref:olfactory receptor 11A1-like n=1 Tax=Hyla sarda TaxID=327740 RepID=UPI0024C366DF|nr:olfactory receptor 11A1-like [Hyla sarda]XP_056400043.1 olfactory receptor 11A1-like [Hyla sarda]
MKRNQTITIEFVLLGFRDLHGLHIPLFLLCLMVYVLCLIGNLMIIVLVSCSQLLDSPMYFFLCHLSVCDMLLTTNIVPSLLHTILRSGRAMPFPDCLTQFQFFASSTGTECLLLTVMSYDRYLAICHPLSYIPIMGAKLRHHLVLGSWGLSFTITLIITVLMSRLNFCGENIIDHFFCDFTPILQLSCSDTRLLQTIDLILTAPVTLLPFMAIIVSYVCISAVIVKIPTVSGRQKAFSTCSSHLTVVTIYYVSLIAIYLVPASGHSMINLKILSLIYTVITPFLNPLIYTLRNKEIKVTFTKIFCFKLKRQENVSLQKQ